MEKSAINNLKQVDNKTDESYSDKLNKVRDESEQNFLQQSVRRSHTDKYFKEKEIFNASFSNTHFLRVVASPHTKFFNVDFSYCILDHAYLRNCSFDSCKFLGAKILNSNLQGTSFVKCDFRYAIFEKTIIDNDFIFNNLPVESNLRYKLLKSLRVNFQQLGESENVNKAILYELHATKQYLWDASFSTDEYYQKKYSGWKKRSISFFKLIFFIFWDFIWGNGEKIEKLLRTFIIVLLIIVLYDMYHVGMPQRDSIQYLYSSLKNSLSVFFNIEPADHFSKDFITFIMFTRLVLFAFFVSILVKRLSRR